jgi:hypothetical protein
MFLAEELEDLLEDVQDALGSLQAAEGEESLSECLESVAELTVDLGLAAFLVEADVERMQRNLAYSGYARRWYLQNVRPGYPEDHRGARSRWPSLVAAIAGGQLELARELAALEPRARVEDGEYDDDFAYSLFIGDLVAGAAEAELARQLTALRGAMPAAPQLVDVLEALLASDEASFVSALENFLQAELRKLVPTYNELRDEIQKRISLNGLMLVQLALARGLIRVMPDLERTPRAASEFKPRAMPDDIITEVRA